ncbi:hypothetical protein ACFODL_14840 [Phenylobacterium terrae]|uniref:Stress-induced protein n=1 Tax=Phenylobacterium terrae TaxID=2665495 RepID=A0ABW4N162_9CAUL
MADNDKLQSEGRDENAAQPLDAARKNAGAERYPSVDQHDAVERTGRSEQVTGEGRTFSTPRQNEHEGMGDATTDGEDVPHSANDGRLGPGGDPVEGKP